MATKPVVPDNQDQSWYQQDPATTNQYRVIPGAGFYMQDQAKAQSAYDRSVAELKANRAKQQITSGLGKDWSVDPHSQYGGYQQMLQGQGSALDSVLENNQQRGFFGSGLGNQGIGAVQYANAVQALGFKNQLADWENQYQTGMTDAERARSAANLGSLQEYYDEGYQNEDYTTSNPNVIYPNSSGYYGGLDPRNKSGPVQYNYGTPTKPQVPKKPTYAAVGPGGRRTTTTSSTAKNRRK